MKQNHYNQSFEKNDIIHAVTMKKNTTNNTIIHICDTVPKYVHL